jgi:hypothetical protein
MTGEEHPHPHPIRISYTLEMNDRHWYGGRVVYELIGTGSSHQNGELIIHLEDGGLWSINYTGVYRMTAKPLQNGEHSHE